MARNLTNLLKSNRYILKDLKGLRDFCRVLRPASSTSEATLIITNIELAKVELFNHCLTQSKSFSSASAHAFTNPLTAYLYCCQSSSTSERMSCKEVCFPAMQDAINPNVNSLICKMKGILPYHNITLPLLQSQHSCHTLIMPHVALIVALKILCSIIEKKIPNR